MFVDRNTEINGKYALHVEEYSHPMILSYISEMTGQLQVSALYQIQSHRQPDLVLTK